MSVIEAKKYHAPSPSKLTLFLRSAVPWQLFRFLIINIRMTLMIAKSHGRYVGPRQSDDD